MPASLAQRLTTSFLSPLIIHISIPISRRLSIASVAWGFSTSRFSSSSVVRVPVLSITSASTPLRFSSAVASFIKMFFCAALPIPTISAVGVASPKAQGHAITSTATADCIACCSLPAMSHHASPVTAAIAITAGTNTAATLSATLCTGAFEPCASSTVRIICASSVSFPTCSARNLSSPSTHIVPAYTRSPSRFSTRAASPVIVASFILAEVRVGVTRPSTGIFSPARTTISSPTCSVTIGTSSVVSPLTM